MEKPNVLGMLVRAKARYSTDPTIHDLGKKMFTLYTQSGFPPTMFLMQLGKKVGLSLLAKIYICSEYQTHYLNHRRKANTISEDKLKKIQSKNVEDIAKLVKTGEFGDY